MSLIKIAFTLIAIGGPGYALFKFSQDAPLWVKFLSLLVGIGTLVGIMIELPQALDAVEETTARLKRYIVSYEKPPPIKYCADGMLKLGSFDQHISQIRQSNRFTTEMIDKLIESQRKDGPDFFKSQIIVKEEPSASGDYDLALFHGDSDTDSKFENVADLGCTMDDYPLVYFVGFHVSTFRDSTIFVSHSEDEFQIISLKSIDPNLNGHMKVVDSNTNSVLCDNISDIGIQCTDKIFTGHW